MAYYVTGNGGNGRYYYGRAVKSMLDALILLDDARRAMPGERWEIVAYPVL